MNSFIRISTVSYLIVILTLLLLGLTGAYQQSCPTVYLQRPHRSSSFVISKPCQEMDVWGILGYRYRKCSSLTTSRNMKENEQEEEGMNSDGVPEELLREAQEAAPSEWAIMKEILGINGFTYVLAALIAFFLTMNAILGPGWMGQRLMGLEGTGTFTQVSDSLPNTIDLSAPDYLL